MIYIKKSITIGQLWREEKYGKDNANYKIVNKKFAPEFAKDWSLPAEEKEGYILVPCVHWSKSGSFKGGNLLN